MGQFVKKGFMPKAKKVEEPKNPRFYKGYDIKWLKEKETEDHPDYNLVAEYEAKYGKVK